MPPKTPSLEDLGVDILFLVADEVNNSVREQIPNFRLVSRQCDLVARPILFRKIIFDDRRLEGAVADEYLKGNLRAHLRHVVLRTWMDWEGLVELLSGCVRFEGLTWRFRGGIGSMMTHFPPKLRDALQTFWKHVDLYVENLRFMGIMTRRQWPSGYVQPTLTLPTANIVSVTTNMGEIWAKADYVHDLLLETRRLRALTLAPPPAPFSVRMKKLPALRRLHLQGRDWSYTSFEVSRIWDILTACVSGHKVVYFGVTGFFYRPWSFWSFKICEDRLQWRAKQVSKSR